MVELSTNINVLPFEENVKEQSSWLRQGCQILDRIEVENHDVGKSSDFCTEASSVHGLNITFILFNTKIYYCSCNHGPSLIMRKRRL